MDIVVVGGGSAGCVLANRLSADPGVTVTVLEAGGPSRWWDLLVRMPMAMPRVVGSPRHDWSFTSEPEPHLLGRRLVHPRGKLIGGSSSINGGVYQRGHAGVFDGWAAELGTEEWDYAHCLPYFQRVENCVSPTAGPTRGHDGPHLLDRAPATGPLFEAFLAAVQQAGHGITPDPNEWQEGFAPFERAVANGRRVSAADAYLSAAGRRANLRVECHTLVTSVMFVGRRAVGVRYRQGDGPEQEIRAGEVILAGGAINSPQLLQLSGVGAPEDLASAGVAPVHKLPGVGHNVQDHLGLFIQHRCTQPVSAMRYRNRLRWPGIAARWLLAGSGPGSTTQIEVGGFARSHPGLDYPDVQLAFAPFIWASDELPTADGHGYELYLGGGRPESRGSITIRSADPGAQPALVFNYLATPADRAFWPGAARIARDILAQPAFSEFSGGELSPGPAVESDEQLLNWVQRTGRTGLHPTSSCRMGTDGMSVVDPSTLRVHGLEGIRVADASVMPSVPNANTYAPVMMIAEKAADLVLGRSPLPPVLNVADPHPA